MTVVHIAVFLTGGTKLGSYMIVNEEGRGTSSGRHPFKQTNKLETAYYRGSNLKCGV